MHLVGKEQWRSNHDLKLCVQSEVLGEGGATIYRVILKKANLPFFYGRLGNCKSGESRKAHRRYN